MAGTPAPFWSRRSLFDEEDDTGSTIERIYEWSVERDVEDDRFLEALESFIFDDDEEDDDDATAKTVKKRAKRSPILEYFDTEGNIVPVPPSESPWYRLYVLADPDKWTEKHHFKFRRRFRMPFKNYKDLVSRVKCEHAIFKRWLGTGQHKKAPIELLLLGTLRYLGRGLTFDDLEEATAISRDVHRVFFHRFVLYGKTSLFNEFVVEPSTQNIDDHRIEYNQAGFHGAVGSMDAVHVLCEKIPFRLKNLHTGHKMSHTARTYNVVVNHRRQILSATRGHPSTYNDKTLVLFDTFARGIHQGDMMSGETFYLKERSVDGEIIDRKYNGVWLITDGGYRNWSTNVPPFKNSVSRKEIRWSEWLESIRKDVECCFGILKGRWRLLKTGIRLHGTSSCDAVFLTCCALHNLLLDADGLNKPWEGGLSLSDYNGELGGIDVSDPAVQNVFALYRLKNPSSTISYSSNFDLSGMGDPTHPSDNDTEEVEVSSVSHSDSDVVWSVQVLLE